ncbi:MAG TPA: hypothetical protein VFL98_03580 [Candidatus Paceibacterota bacterium]|nr:hypothetical protein [Candidatus Paceibacterota bacterium]
MEFDFNAVPEKVFVDTVHLRVINGLLHVVLRSGDAMDCYLLPLPLAKLMGKGIMAQVEEIEKKHNISFDEQIPEGAQISPWTIDSEEGGK